MASTVKFGEILRRPSCKANTSRATAELSDHHVTAKAFHLDKHAKEEDAFIPTSSFTVPIAKVKTCFTTAQKRLAPELRYEAKTKKYDLDAVGIEPTTFHMYVSRRCEANCCLLVDGLDDEHPLVTYNHTPRPSALDILRLSRNYGII